MRTRSPIAKQTVGTDIITEAFDSDVINTAIADFVDAVEVCVATLRDRITGDDRLERLSRSQLGVAVLKLNDTAENGDPDPLTQRAVIESLLSEPGYENLTGRRDTLAKWVTGSVEATGHEFVHAFALKEIYEQIPNDV